MLEFSKFSSGDLKLKYLKYLTKYITSQKNYYVGKTVYWKILNYSQE